MYEKDREDGSDDDVEENERDETKKKEKGIKIFLLYFKILDKICKILKNNMVL